MTLGVVFRSKFRIPVQYWGKVLEFDRLGFIPPNHECSA